MELVAMKFVSLAGMMALAAMPTLAQASPEVGTQSTGSVSIRVVIPPFAAALRAQSEGAVGLWTIANTSGLMIQLPDQIEANGKVDAAIYRSRDVQFTVSVKSPMVELKPKTAEVLNGLTRESFGLAAKSLPNDAAAMAGAGHPDPVVFLVTGL
jgi:hypothetical protein